MERETDCKIAIRGKGSVKEGARRGPTAVDADDELHVYISGETEDSVEKVCVCVCTFVSVCVYLWLFVCCSASLRYLCVSSTDGPADLSSEKESIFLLERV